MLSTACALRATSARARTHLRAVAVARDPAGQSAAPAAAEPGPPSVRRVARLARAGEHQVLLGPKVAQLERHVRRRGQTILIAGEHCKLVADRARGHRGTKSGTLVEVERPRPAPSRQLTLVRRTLHWPARRRRANGAPAAPRFEGPPTSSADREQVAGVGANEEQRCVHHGGGGGCHERRKTRFRPGARKDGPVDAAAARAPKVFASGCELVTWTRCFHAVGQSWRTLYTEQASQRARRASVCEGCGCAPLSAGAVHISIV